MCTRLIFTNIAPIEVALRWKTFTLNIPYCSKSNKLCCNHYIPKSFKGCYFWTLKSSLIRELIKQTHSGNNYSCSRHHNCATAKSSNTDGAVSVQSEVIYHTESRQEDDMNAADERRRGASNSSAAGRRLIVWCVVCCLLLRLFNAAALLLQSRASSISSWRTASSTRWRHFLVV